MWKVFFFFKLKKLSTKIYFSLEICALISRVWEISFRYCFYLSAFKVQNQKQLDVFRTLTDHFQFINVYFWLSCCSELLFFCKQSWIYLSKGPYFPKYKSLFWKKIHQAWHSAVFTINTIFTSNLCPSSSDAHQTRRFSKNDSILDALDACGRSYHQHFLASSRHGIMNFTSHYQCIKDTKEVKRFGNSF